MPSPLARKGRRAFGSGITVPGGASSLIRSSSIGVCFDQIRDQTGKLQHWSSACRNSHRSNYPLYGPGDRTLRYEADHPRRSARNAGAHYNFSSRVPPPHGQSLRCGGIPHGRDGRRSAFQNPRPLDADIRNVSMHSATCAGEGSRSLLVRSQSVQWNRDVLFPDGRVGVRVA
jgi:hypothetical protein